jgi:hypothetical protein
MEIPEANVPNSIRRRLRPAASLLAAAALLLLVSCDSTRPYSTLSVKFAASEGDRLHFIVERESGVATTRPGPCPVTVCSRERLSVYRVTYRLADSSSVPTVSGALEFGRGGKAAPKDRVPAGESQFDATDAEYCRRLNVPGTTSLYANANPSIVRVESAADPDDARLLQRLGFDTRRIAYRTDTAEGRWYLGFDPFALGVQVCCPRRGTFRSRSLQVNHSAIWEPGRFRLLVFGESPHNPRIIGLPSSATVWDYGRDSLTSFNLAPISPEDLH